MQNDKYVIAMLDKTILKEDVVILDMILTNEHSLFNSYTHHLEEHAQDNNFYISQLMCDNSLKLLLHQLKEETLIDGFHAHILDDVQFFINHRLNKLEEVPCDGCQIVIFSKSPIYSI